MILWYVLLFFWGISFGYLFVSFIARKYLTGKELTLMIIANFLTAIFANELWGSQTISYLLGIY